MSTVNNRVLDPQALTINAIAAGGITNYQIQIGYDDELQNPVDGHELAMADFLTEFCRGNFSSQDWVHFIELLTGTVGTSVFYERESGKPVATGYLKHTLNNPVIYKTVLNLRHRKYADIQGSFECRAADETEGILDMWTHLSGQAAPTALETLRALEITACTHASAAVYHVVGLTLTVEMRLFKASNDGDIGYTAVEALASGLKVSGSLIFQDASVATAKIKAAALVTAARGSLALTVKQSQGATAKTLTIAGVKFASGSHDTSAGSTAPDEFSLPFVVTNNFTTPLTLAGANKIITIA